MTEYRVDEEIAAFFSKATATREECHERAVALAGGSAVEPLKIQGSCSYTVFAGEGLESVVQFRQVSLELPIENIGRARALHGDLVPKVSEHGQLGSDTDGEREPVLVYMMNRIKGITHLDFILAHRRSNNTPENFAQRKALMADVARFFAQSWKAAQPVDSVWREKTYNEYRTELELLLGALPERFHPVIQGTIDALTAIISLPAVLVHNDLRSTNLLVSEPDCHLVGVVDWADAATAPFGTNLHELLTISGELRLQKGVVWFDDHKALQETFWEVLRAEVGLGEEEVIAIKAARVLGLLRSHGFTNRLVSSPKPVPIGDDEVGRYNMLYLDGLLLNPETKYDSDIQE